MLIELFVIICGLYLILLFLTQRRPKGFPPGPTGIPLLGYLPFIAKSPPKQLAELSKTYGDVFSIYFANYPVVILSSLSAIKEAFKDDRFAGRPPLKIAKDRSWGAQRGIIFGVGSFWTEQRRFTLKNLRDFGFGKGSMETLINDEVVELVQELKKELNQPISLSKRFNASVVNALWHIVAGERYSLDDPKLARIIDILVANLEKLSLSGPLFFMEWLTNMAPGFTGYTRFMESVIPIYGFLKEHVDSHKKNLTSSNSNDLIEAYLKEIASTTSPKSSFFKDEGEKNLLVVLLDLFVAGTDTTSTTLSWAILFLITNPEVQVKVQHEIDSVVGSGRLPTLSDRMRMPCMEAMIAETLRMSSITPLGVLHSATETFEFRGHLIPKDTIVMPNLWQLHNDIEFWGDPQVFRPDRFLTQEGTFRKDDALNPFSTGKRVCLGEGLARDQLFLFLSGMLQKLTFELEKGVSTPSYEPTLAVVAKPQPYKVVVRERVF